MVVQPWTEDPDLETNATEPKLKRFGRATPLYISALASMHAVAANMQTIAKRRYFDKELRRQLGFLGENNVKNASAVKNLMTMAKNVYVHAGSKSGLERVLRGVKVEVLGPPTVKQHEAVKGQRSKDPDEFWQLQARRATICQRKCGRRQHGRAAIPETRAQPRPKISDRCPVAYLSRTAIAG